MPLPIDSHNIVAFACFDTIIVYSADTRKNIYEIKKWKDVKDYQLPYIDWGIGDVPGIEGNNHPLLAVGWGKAI